jgi:hypothetical protein
VLVIRWGLRLKGLRPQPPFHWPQALGANVCRGAQRRRHSGVDRLLLLRNPDNRSIKSNGRLHFPLATVGATREGSSFSGFLHDFSANSATGEGLTSLFGLAFLRVAFLGWLGS